jgi:hypothetical protein
VTVLGGLEVDWLGKVELLDDNTWPHVEVGLDDGNELLAGLGGSSI